MIRLRRSKIPDLILASDFHLREDSPICRVDDFWEAQWDKIGQIAYLQNKFDCPVLHSGDLFHHWKPSPYLLSKTIECLPDEFYTVYGQHDLPQHNFDLRNKSGIYALEWAEALTTLTEGHWGQEPASPSGYPKVAMWHKFVWDGKKIPWPGCDEMTALEVLKKYPQYDLIVTGDHHKSFTQVYEGRRLVNPGCLTRQASDYAYHKPCVYFWYEEDNTIQVHYLNVEEGIVSKEHIEKQKARDKRIEAFISRLDNDWEISVSFEENLDRFLKNNRMRSSVVELIYKAIGS